MSLAWFIGEQELMRQTLQDLHPPLLTIYINMLR